MPTTLSGTLDTFSLADLLQWLEINGLSGRVSISRGEVKRTIDLKGGQIVYVSSSRPDERLGTFLVGRGVLADTAVYELLAENFITGKNLTRLILDRAFLSRERLAEVVETLALQVLLDLFHWSGAAFEYDPSFATEDLLNIQLSLRGQVLAFHGVKSVDDTARIRISLAPEEDPDSRWEREFLPEALVSTFWGLVEGLGGETPGHASIRDRYLVFSRFASKVKAAIEAPFRPLTPFPDTAELLRTALREELGDEQVVRIAALDPFFTLDLLFLVNALRSGRRTLVGTASQALSAIGRPALRHYVELLTDPSVPAQRDRLDRLVRRVAVSTAVATSHVATATQKDAELAYTLGLLEPLGGYDLLKLLLTEDFEPGPFRVAALSQFRALYGGLLARKLNLPVAFADVLGSSGVVSSRDPETEQMVYLARQMVPSDQIGREWTSEDPELADRLAAMTVDSELPTRIARDVAGVRELLNL